MTKKFNCKQYQGKPRVYTPVTGAAGVARLWVWDEGKKHYAHPTRGKCYEARRRADGKRLKQSFETLEQARQWQSSTSHIAVMGTSEQVAQKQGMLFSELIAEWRKRTYSRLDISTQVSYDKLVRIYFGSLAGLTVYELTPQRLDQWLDELKNPKGSAMQSKLRKSFRHELGVLSAILKYYENYHDDVLFRFPIKQRHRDAIELNRPVAFKSKDLTEEEFLKFRACLSQRMHGKELAVLATIQYYQALRISEAAGLYWEDVQFDAKEPRASRLKVVRAVCWPRKKGLDSFVKDGFKNSGANAGIKEQPLFIHAYQALQALRQPGGTGLIFQVDGRHFEYRQLQFAYDEAFQAAGLPYRGTHVMRHGGCRHRFNQTGDVSIAQQHLGNSSLQTTLVYAKRSTRALTEVSEAEWAELEKDLGRNGSQTPVAV